MAHLVGIACRPARRAAVTTMDEGRIDASAGLVGDHRQRPGRRQVSVLTAEGWEAACAELGIALPWTLRRANLLVAGLDLRGRVGHRLVLGEAVLEITGELDPCRRMDDAHPGLMAALVPSWRGGATCRVVTGGRIRAGDGVDLLLPDAR